MAEGVRNKRQGEVCQCSSKGSVAARLCSSLKKGFPLPTDGRLFSRNLSFHHPSQHEILNPKRNTNVQIQIFCVMGKKAALLVPFSACIMCQKGHGLVSQVFQVTVLCPGVEMRLPVPEMKTEVLCPATEVWEQASFFSWRYARLSQHRPPWAKVFYTATSKFIRDIHQKCLR